MHPSARTLTIAVTTALGVASLAATAQAAPMTGVRISAPAALRTIVPGSRISTTVTLTNQRARRSGRGTVRLYLSTDGQGGRGARLEQRDVAALAPHARKRLTLSGRIPAGLAAGRYRLLVSLDSRGTVFNPDRPSHRTNSKPAPDPTPLVAAAAPSIVAPGPAPAAPAAPTAPVVPPPVAPVDHAPTADDVVLTTPQDTAAAVHVSATDADGDALTYATTQPAHGSLSGTAPDLTYTPDDSYRGADTFTYTAADATATSAPATVAITVSAVNHAPVAVDDSATTAEDAPLTVPAPGVLANDTDADGDALTAVLVSDPAHGAVVLADDGSYTYTPAANYHGADGFSYRVGDGLGGSDVAAVSLTVTAVNHRPVAVADSYTAHESTDLTVAAPGVLANDTDADGDPLTAYLITSPSHGNLTLDLDGSFVYTPDAGYDGPDTFQYLAGDGLTNSATAGTVVITVANQAPVAVADTYITAHDTVLTVAGPGVLVNDSDPEHGALAALQVTEPVHGTLWMNPGASGSFIYTPEAGWSGTDSFTYQAMDDHSNFSTTATVTLLVTPPLPPCC
jgi:VCBS repeat-containing protein